jgi:hypothetical protein
MALVDDGAHRDIDVRAATIGVAAAGPGCAASVSR